MAKTTKPKAKKKAVKTKAKPKAKPKQTAEELEQDNLINGLREMGFWACDKKLEDLYKDLSDEYAAGNYHKGYALCKEIKTAFETMEYYIDEDKK